ncbi:MAG: DUF861 domain-containing protein [Acidobacteria bacterium]|jgi:uncharacterized cupin superfamily protein|nr:DUF861 domain-containing protein [Acidobacteriota bacterium]
MNVDVKVNKSHTVKLASSPIPESVITAGRPAAKGWTAAQSGDAKVTQGVWECTAGKFNWEYAWDEFVMILEGEAIVTSVGGKPETLRAGDFCYFPAGLKMEWNIPHYVRKTFVIRTQEAMPA